MQTVNDYIFTGSKSYCQQKLKDMLKRGWKVASYRDIHGGKQVYRLTYVGMELINGNYHTRRETDPS